MSLFSFVDSTYYNGKSISELLDKTLTSVDIPSTYQGAKVVQLEVHSFYSAAIEKVFIPKTIKYIRECAFQDCHKLTEVRFELGSELENMDDDVFAFDYSLKKIDIPSSLKKLLNYLLCSRYLSSF